MDSNVKIVLVGDSGVGKSCLLERYCDGHYKGAHVSTIGVDYRTRQVKLGKDTFIAQIFDTAGQERFRAISASYYRKAQGIMVVIDITSAQTVNNVGRWVKELQKNCAEDVCKLIVVNKCDQSWSVPVDRLDELSKTYDIPVLRVSAKTGENVAESFDLLISRIVETHSVVPKQDIILDRSTKKESGCCL